MATRGTQRKQERDCERDVDGEGYGAIHDEHTAKGICPETLKSKGGQRRSDHSHDRLADCCA
jgi:hypothetical protein